MMLEEEEINVYLLSSPMGWWSPAPQKVIFLTHHIAHRTACDYQLLHQACENSDISLPPLTWTREQTGRANLETSEEKWRLIHFALHTLPAIFTNKTELFQPAADYVALSWEYTLCSFCWCWFWASTTAIGVLLEHGRAHVAYTYGSLNSISGSCRH